MLGATRKAMELIPLANAEGFSPDICSYLTSDIGSYLKGETPLQKMGMSGVPKADVLVFNTNQCRDVKDWFQWYARQWDVPCLGIHTPRGGRRRGRAAGSVCGQPDRSVGRAAGSSGRHRSWTSTNCGRSFSCPNSARRCGSKCWRPRPTCRPRSPSLTGPSRWGPAVVMRGTPEAVDYLQGAVGRIGAARSRTAWRRSKGETTRIYWEGMPIWGKLKDLVEPVSPAADLRRRLDLLQ